MSKSLGSALILGLTRVCRWDYIFSFIKRRRADRTAVLPDRSDVTMEVPFMDAYVRLLIQTCHRRKVAAMGGMSAQIPIKDDPKANEIAMNKVRADKLREVKNGHDGTWIAHPLINQIASEIFNEHMVGPNQVSHPDCAVVFSMLTSGSVPCSPGGRTGHRCRSPQYLGARQDHRRWRPLQRRHLARIQRCMGRR